MPCPESGDRASELYNMIPFFTNFLVIPRSLHATSLNQRQKMKWIISTPNRSFNYTIDQSNNSSNNQPTSPSNNPSNNPLNISYVIQLGAGALLMCLAFSMSMRLSRRG